MEFICGFHPLGMKQISHVSIPDPCTQKWDSMKPNADGKFCDSCQKMVTDFTKLSNTDIINILGSSSNVCGRFDPAQLNSLNNQLAPKYTLPVWQRVGIAASLIMLTPFVAVKAQVKQKVRQHKTVKPLVLGTIEAKIPSIIITGNVVYSTSKQAVALVSVIANGSQRHVVTDSLGNFRMEILPQIDTVLMLSGIGLQAHSVKLSKTQIYYPIQLEAQELIFAQREELLTCLVGGISVKRSFLWMAWYHIKKPFINIFR